jgi:outer membrane protein assembly factor BamE
MGTHQKRFYPTRVSRGAAPARMTFLISTMAVLISGCGYVPQFITPHRMEIQQGNMVSQDMVSKLTPGMTKDQVRFMLGTPLVVDPFRVDRWDYIFIRQPENSKEIEKRRIAVFFESNKLVRVEGDVVAAATNAAPAAK